MRIEHTPLAELVRAPRNAKSHDLGALHVSIERFGYVMPILVDDESGTIVAGHGRLDALTQRKAEGRPPPERVEVDDAGEWLVPTIRGVAFSDPREAEAYLLADNRLVELGGWDESVLAEMLTDLAQADALLGSGFDADDIPTEQPHAQPERKKITCPECGATFTPET